MRALFKVIMLLAAVALVGMYYFVLYPELKLKYKAEHMIVDFNTVVATHDRGRIGAALSALFADQAHVKLGITYQTFLKGEKTPVEAMDFNKTDLISTFTNYGTPMVQEGTLELRNFQLGTDDRTATMSFGYHGADVLFYLPSSGAPGERRRMDMDCTGQLDISAGNLLLSGVDCMIYFANPVRALPETK